MEDFCESKPIVVKGDLTGAINKNMTEAEKDRHAYAYEYRTMLKSVITEALRENQSVIGGLFKEAVKEWLTEQFADKTALMVRGLAAILFLGMVWIVFRPK